MFDTNRQLAKTLLKKKPLIKLVAEYNQCMSERSGGYQEIIEVDPKVILDFGLTGGMNFSYITARNDSFTGNPEFDSNFQGHLRTGAITWNPNFGITLTGLFPRFSNNIAFYTAIQYSFVSYEIGSQDGSTDFYSEIDQNIISVPIILQFRTLEKSLGYLVEVGRNQEFHFSTNYYNLSFDGSNKTELPSDLYEIDKVQSVFSLGLGVYKSLSSIQAQFIMRIHAGYFQTNFNDEELFNTRQSFNIIISRRKVIKN